MNTSTFPRQQIDRKKLIQSYGFVEHLATNENFLQESLALATRITSASIAYISLLDDEFQYILSQHESDLKTIRIEESICQFTIKDDNILVIEDTKINELTSCLPQVNKEDGVKFYAGFPLINDEHIKVGALCVMDSESQSLSKTQQDTLVVLGKQIMTTLDNQRSMIKLIKKINTNFKPAACADLNCLKGELAHLQDEVVAQNKLIKDQKKELEKANKELLNFANMVAHDVRAPLRTINSFVGLHERELKNSNKTYETEYLSFIKQATTNLDDLTNDLLAYARSGAEAVESETLSLKQLLETVTFNLTETIKTANAEVLLPMDSFKIYGKRLQLIQLFQNLIGNGLKYQGGDEPPRVSILAKEVNDKVRISIVDNGIGISKDNLKEIFQPFKRLHSDKEYSGSGIGLATCKKIIDALGSEFIVTSEVGKGTTFVFDLPIHK